MTITGMTIKRGIDPDKVRDLCISHEWYTRGDSQSYIKMLEKAHHKQTSDSDYFTMAEDIYNHSDIDRMCNEYGIDEEECIRIILSELINASYNFVEVALYERS